MRLTLIIFSLQDGGAERVLVRMANYWASKGWTLTLLTLDNGSNPPFYELSPKIVHRALNLASKSPTLLRAFGSSIRRVRVLRGAIHKSKPQAVISFMDQTNTLVLLATVGLAVPVIVSERTNPRRSPIGTVWKVMRLLLYPLAAYVVTQTRAAKEYFPTSLQRRIVVIPNPVVLEPGQGHAEVTHGITDRELTGRKRIVIAMGRLAQEKGFDLLLHAFARVAPYHPEWQLNIWGEGALRNELQVLRRQLGLVERVCLPGRTASTYSVMRNADLFVLSSRFEGFPNALCEAMASGLPVVSFDCPNGPGQIIRDGVDGVLVPPENVDALAAALESLFTDSGEREKLASRAPEILGRYGLERIMAEWEHIISEVT